MNNSEKQFSLSLNEVRKKIIPSFANLLARQVFLRFIGFISINVVLARILSVETLGIFNIATGVITFFAFFSDVGLAASLIQKKNEIKEEDINTAFTIQQILVGFLSLSIILGASFIGQFYHLNDDGVWLVRALGVTFMLSSLKVIPSVLLERVLRFQPLVLVEVAETLVFNGLLILLAWNNLGLWSFTYAALCRGLVGVILIYILAPAKVGIGISRESAKQLLSFGVPFQLNNILALLKDRLVPLVVARLVSPVGVGYITWSQSMAFLPLEVMNIVIRITFPAFSRLQEDKESLGKAVEKSLFVTALLVYPALFGLGAILPAMVAFIISPKWQAALPSFYLFAFSSFWAVISTTFTNALNAMGHIKITLKLMIMWTVLTWVLTPMLVLAYGFIGVAAASFLISFTSVLTIIMLKRVLAVRVLHAIYIPIIASLVMGISVFGFTQAYVKNWQTLIVAMIFGGSVYALIILAVGRKRIMNDIKSLKYA